MASLVISIPLMLSWRATYACVVVPSNHEHRKVLSRPVCFVLSMTNPVLLTADYYTAHCLVPVNLRGLSDRLLFCNYYCILKAL